MSPHERAKGSNSKMSPHDWFRGSMAESNSAEIARYQGIVKPKPYLDQKQNDSFF
jgi:hypothetical protein